MIKVRSKEQLKALQVTGGMIAEPGQATIRSLVGNVQAAEVFPGRIVIHTRKNRYSFGTGKWVVLDGFGNIEILTDSEFQHKYEAITE